MTFDAFQRIQARREFLRNGAGGLGMIALAQMLGADQHKRTDPLAPKPPHFAPKAKNVIFLYMEGAPSHIDLFDPKPEMKKWDGQPLPEGMTKALKLAFIKRNAKVWASPRVFQRFGQCGMEFSDYLPHLATCADNICMVRSMFTEQFNHHPGQLMFNCGTPLVG